MRNSKTGRGLRRSYPEELTPAEMAAVHLREEIHNLSKGNDAELAQIEAMISQVQTRLSDYVEAKVLPSELEACKFCGEASQMLLIDWVGDTKLCTPCLMKSPRLLMIATMLQLKRRLVIEESSGQHRLDLVRNLQGLFDTIQSVIPNIHADLLVGEDQKAQIIEQKFIKAGHKPSDPTCSHAVYFAITGPRPRHCPACMSSMVDYGD